MVQTNYFLQQMKCCTFKALAKAHKYIVKESKLDFKYYPGGCQHRSHFISLMLSAKFKIQHNKVWLMSPCLTGGEDRKFKILVESGLCAEPEIQWNFHTAPLIPIADKHKAMHDYVIDPLIDSKNPILLQDWINEIDPEKIGKVFVSASNEYFFNSKPSELFLLPQFDGTFFGYINPSKDNLMMEKGLAANDTAIKVFNKFINNPKTHPEEAKNLRAIFGNAFCLDMLLSQNQSPGQESQSLRNIVEIHTDVLHYARKYYFKRLKYWTLLSNELMEQLP